jgi:hypothetical protein
MYGEFPDESPVEVRYPRSNQEEQADRDTWPWLPGSIVEQCGPDEWYVCVEVREVAVLRQRSDASHEASHLLLDHDVKEVEQLGGLSFFTCDPDEEQEANWLAGCLLLPRDLLVRSLKHSLDVAAIAEANAVSLQMANFRLRATGAERQAAPWRR